MVKKSKKKEILDAAFHLLKESGDISSLNLRKTARLAGCAHTNVYNYFPNLEALKWAMLEQALHMLEKFIFDVSEKQNDIIKVISRYIDFAFLHPELYKLIWITNLSSEFEPSDTGSLTRIPDRLLMYADPVRLDTAYSFVHGKLVNIIFSRTKMENPETTKANILKICKGILEE